MARSLPNSDRKSGSRSRGARNTSSRPKPSTAHQRRPRPSNIHQFCTRGSRNPRISTPPRNRHPKCHERRGIPITTKPTQARRHTHILLPTSHIACAAKLHLFRIFTTVRLHGGRPNRLLCAQTRQNNRILNRFSPKPAETLEYSSLFEHGTARTF